MKQSKYTNLDISQKHLSLIVDTLANYAPDVEFYAYGSRTKAKAHRYSDLDICYKGQLIESRVTELYFAFIESSLPFRVDIHAYSDFSDEFRSVIAKDLVALTQKD